MDDTLALNERERLTQIYTVRNANEKLVKKSMQNVAKIHKHTEQKIDTKRNKIAATSWGAWLNLT